MLCRATAAYPRSLFLQHDLEWELCLSSDHPSTDSRANQNILLWEKYFNITKKRDETFLCWINSSVLRAVPVGSKRNLSLGPICKTKHCIYLLDIVPTEIYAFAYLNCPCYSSVLWVQKNNSKGKHKSFMLAEKKIKIYACRKFSVFSFSHIHLLFFMLYVVRK